MHVITPSDLKKFQIDHYSKLLEKPTSETHKKFLKQQIKQLQNERIHNTDDHSDKYNACVSIFCKTNKTGRGIRSKKF
jgi:hypothetical protein